MDNFHLVEIICRLVKSSPENNAYVFNMGFTEADRFGQDSEVNSRYAKS